MGSEGRVNLFQDSGEARVAPSRVLSCSPKEHCANFFGRRRAANRYPAVRRVELLRDEPSVPAEDCVGSDDVEI